MERLQKLSVSDSAQEPKDSRFLTFTIVFCIYVLKRKNKLIQYLKNRGITFTGIIFSNLCFERKLINAA